MSPLSANMRGMLRREGLPKGLETTHAAPVDAGSEGTVPTVQSAARPTMLRCPQVAIRGEQQEKDHRAVAAEGHVSYRLNTQNRTKKT